MFHLKLFKWTLSNDPISSTWCDDVNEMKCFISLFGDVECSENSMFLSTC